MHGARLISVVSCLVACSSGSSAPASDVDSGSASDSSLASDAPSDDADVDIDADLDAAAEVDGGTCGSIHFMSDTCDACLRSSCCIVSTNCGADADCVALLSCGSDAACKSAHVKGQWWFSGVVSCARNDCASECGLAGVACGGIGLTPAACDACAKSSCCDAMTACGTSDACNAFVYQCLDQTGCATGGACEAPCRKKYPDGAKLYDAANTCLAAKCASTCF
jgi:hypothetical protein